MNPSLQLAGEFPVQRANALISSGIERQDCTPKLGNCKGVGRVRGKDRLSTLIINYL